MTRTGLLIRMLQRGRAQPGAVGAASVAASFRLCAGLAAAGRPIVRGQLGTGSPILLDVRDPAQREILWTGQTEAGSAALLARLATPGWTVVDVGANAGFYTLLAWDLGQRRGRGLAFEPNPRMAAMLRRSIEDATATAIDVVDAACGGASGRTVLHLSSNAGQAAFATVRPEMRWSDDWLGITVEITTLDDECRRRDLVPDLVKIDAEGSESEVIAGMSGLLADRIPSNILCEVAVGWERPDPTPWIEVLRNAGYDAAVVGERGVCNPLTSLANETIQNVCFTRMG